MVVWTLFTKVLSTFIKKCSHELQNSLWIVHMPTFDCPYLHENISEYNPGVKIYLHRSSGMAFVKAPTVVMHTFITLQTICLDTAGFKHAADAFIKTVNNQSWQKYYWQSEWCDLSNRCSCTAIDIKIRRYLMKVVIWTPINDSMDKLEFEVYNSSVGHFSNHGLAMGHKSIPVLNQHLRKLSISWWRSWWPSVPCQGSGAILCNSLEEALYKCP